MSLFRDRVCSWQGSRSLVKRKSDLIMSQIQNNKDLVYQLQGWVTVTQVTYFA